MKKIISMLCVVAMMLSFVAISANAADIAVSLVENKVKATDDKLAYDLVVKHTDGIKGVTMQLDFSDFIAKNDGMQKTDITAEKVDATGANPVTTGTNAFISSNYNDPNGAETEITMFTVYINKANFKNDATFTFRSACKLTPAGSTVNVFSSAVQSGATIAAPAGKDYEDLSADVVVATGNTVGTDLTDCQVGTGFYAKFNVPAALDSMKWSAKIGGVRKFSTKAIDLKPYDGIEVGADVVLYGAFTNGEHSENGFTAKKETETVTSPGIIVKSGETFYASADAFAE